MLPIKGVDLENVFSLRTPDDANKIAQAAAGKNVVIIGSSFIGGYQPCQSLEAIIIIRVFCVSWQIIR